MTNRNPVAALLRSAESLFHDKEQRFVKAQLQLRTLGFRLWIATARHAVLKLRSAFFRPLSPTRPLAHSSQIRSFCLLSSVFCLLSFASCSSLSSPRITEVSARKRTQEVEDEGKRQIFLRDRASRLEMESKPLPPHEQRQEFYVRWSGRGISLVKFEYRQINRPNKIFTQDFKLQSGGEDSPSRPPSFHTFTIIGKDFIEGGTVSAWRVSLWSSTETNKSISEKKSALW